MRLDIIGRVCRDCAGKGEFVVHSPDRTAAVSECPTCGGVGRVPAGGGLKWTADTPMASGVYFVAEPDGKGPEAVYVWVPSPPTAIKPRVRRFNSTQSRAMDSYSSALWYGPVTPPEAPG